MRITDLWCETSSHSKNKDAKIIALAGGDSAQEKDRMVHGGICHFSTPPIDPEKFIGKINRPQYRQLANTINSVARRSRIDQID